jgi:hypothetical protein
MSISSISAQSHLQRNAAAWLVLVLVAIALFSIATAALEVRAGIIPSDGAISFEFGGE